MRVSSINSNLSHGSRFPKLSNNNNILRKAAFSVTLFASSLITTSCYQVYEPPLDNKQIIDTSKVHKSDDILLPDTVNQPIVQDIKDIHQRINTVFESLGIIKSGKTIGDIKSLKFEDAKNNKYDISEIKQTEEGFEFSGTVKHNGTEEDLLIKLTDGVKYINRTLICVETSFNKIHNYSMIYQNRWRLGADGKPERRLFQNRTNKYVDQFNRSEYYPYDGYNVFALRKTENGVSSKDLSNGKSFSASDEIKNINVVYY